MVEIKVQSFLDENHERVVSYLDEHAELIKEEEQETILYSNGLRLERKDTTTIKKAHLTMQVDNAETAKELLNLLGQTPQTIWKKKVRKYDWRGIQATITTAPEFVTMLELTKTCSEEERLDVYTALKEALHELGLRIATPEEFEKRFKEFKHN